MKENTANHEKNKLNDTFDAKYSKQQQERKKNSANN